MGFLAKAFLSSDFYHIKKSNSGQLIGKMMDQQSPHQHKRILDYSMNRLIRFTSGNKFILNKTEIIF